MATNRQKSATPQRTSIPTQILDDLSTRFVINIPKEERNDLIRVCFQLELAHWHYLDFICQESPDLPRHNFTKFCVIIFRHIPFLTKFLPDLDTHIAKWKEYKQSVPTCGAILLDASLDHVLLVQGFGGRSWGFPKGKINENEPFVTCAAREVKEETGYDCSHQISGEHFLERNINESSTIRLYIVRDVDTEFGFKPLARNEIKDIKWFDISELPMSREANPQMPGTNANLFYTVCPFVGPLRRWITKERQMSRHKLQQKAQNGIQSDRFWAKSWDNIKFDWDSIWRDVHRE